MIVGLALLTSITKCTNCFQSLICLEAPFWILSRVQCKMLTHDCLESTYKIWSLQQTVHTNINNNDNHCQRRTKIYVTQDDASIALARERERERERERQRYPPHLSTEDASSCRFLLTSEKGWLMLLDIRCIQDQQTS